MSFEYTTISQNQAALASGTALKQLVQGYLARIETSTSNAVVEVFHEFIASQLTKLSTATTESHPLLGCIVAIKDNMCLKDHKVEASSNMLKGFESLYTATAVQRLIDAGAIIIGRTNCDEFAMGSGNLNSAHGIVKNPIDSSKVAGGSSGGAAAAICENLCTIALGSDTGGSIRLPASFVGKVGYKPSYGRISRYGLLAFGSSFDQIGPLAHSVDDAALVSSIMAGIDEHDSTTSSRPSSEININTKFDSNITFGYYKEVLEHPSLNAEVKAAFDAKLDELKQAGHTIKELSMPILDKLVPTYYILTTAEASSNLARYDGVHFGHQSEEGNNLEEVYKNSRSEGFGTEVKRRILLGTFVLSSEHVDAYFTQAQKVRNVIRTISQEHFKQVDTVISPTGANTAFGIDEIVDPVAMYLNDIFTVQANLNGNPSISIPLGNNKKNMPFGLQLTTNFMEDGKLLSIATQL